MSNATLVPSSEPTVTSVREVSSEPVVTHRVSWGAVLAGVTVALVTQLLLGVLGLATGASTIDPLHEQNPTGGLGTGAGVWFVLSGLISLFAGGWTAGRMAGIHRVVDSTLHGVLTWGVATLFTFYLLTTGVGSIIGGAACFLRQGASVIGQGVASASPAVGDAIRGPLQDQGIDWDAIKQNANEMLQQTGKPELQTDAMTKQTKEAGEDAKQAAGSAAANPQASDQQLSGLLDKVFNRVSETGNAADREALVNVVAARTGKSKDEASQVVANWEKTYQQAKEQYEKAKEVAAQKAREAANATARGVTHAAFWTFAAMFVGLGAAAIGGFMSVPDHLWTALVPVRTTRATR